MLAFIKREKIYILILFFILAMNVMQHGQVEKVDTPQEKSLSSMTFEEIGVTEEKAKAFLESDKISARFFRYSIMLGFLVFIGALLSNISFIFRKKPRMDFKTLADKKPVPWGISDIIRVSVIVIFIGYLIAIAEAFVSKIFHLEMSTNFRMILNTFFVDIFACIVLVYFVVIKYQEDLASLGLRFSSFFKNILSGLGAYVFIIPSLLVILLLSVWLLNVLGYTPPPQPVFEAFMAEKRSRVLLFLTIFVSVLGPIVEEMFFRGFMYTAIKKRLGVFAAALLSASIFSLLHTNIVGFLPIMTLGLLLAYLYETTGSIIPSITVHIVHNSIILAFVFFIKEVIA